MVGVGLAEEGSPVSALPSLPQNPHEGLGLPSAGLALLVNSHGLLGQLVGTEWGGWGH